jgi:UDP-N-acetylglucosamine diphosphorylase/glucosamine-1-phosphate N-acetyltransferase
MRLCLFEDLGVADLEPLTLTRPVFNLLCGLGSLGDKQRRHFGCPEVGALVRPPLAPICHLLHAQTPVNDLAWLRAEPTILLNGRWLPPGGSPPGLSEPCVAMIGNEVAYAFLRPEQLAACSPNTLDDCLETWKNHLPVRPAGGRLIHYLWDLIEWNAEQICLDYESTISPACARRVPEGLALVGPIDRLLVDPTARIDPMILVDTTRGPVVIDREAVVTAFSRLEGPCYIGPRTHVLGARIRAATTLGAGCRVGGEVECSIVQGHTNKYHEGFLGHSYVGEWVNFGSGTQNSDLRNDYGEISVRARGRFVATGKIKVGCFVGDHSKTGLGTLLNAGTNVGVFCNLLPSGGYVPRHVPSFSNWWNGAISDNTNLSQLLQAATEVMRRRGHEFTETHGAFVRLLYDQTAAERHHAVQTMRYPARQSA